MQTGETTNERVPLLEVIACSVADAIEAQRGGADRLEVIRDFPRGGLTPPIELVAEILEAVTIPVRVMLREGESYEVVSEAEKEKLCAAARRLSVLNVDGMVLGFLDKGEIDVSLIEAVLSCSPNLPATFHHAFEEADDHLEAISVLKRISQVDRILASGGSGEWPAKIDRLARYQEAAGPEIKILAGGGMDHRSIRMLCEATDIREFHVGRAVREPFAAVGVVRSDLVQALVETTRSLECLDFMQ